MSTSFRQKTSVSSPSQSSRADGLQRCGTGTRSSPTSTRRRLKWLDAIPGIGGRCNNSRTPAVHQLDRTRCAYLVDSYRHEPPAYLAALVGSPPSEVHGVLALLDSDWYRSTLEGARVTFRSDRR